MRKTFLEFLSLKETTEVGKQAPSEIKLCDDCDFKPFIVDAENNSALRSVVQAFLNSDKTNLPGADGSNKLTTMDASKGEIPVKLKKKGLYLVGGAVRDHLLNKTPKDYDLATDATPEEIRLILRSNKFTETKPQGGKHINFSGPIVKRYEKHPEPGAQHKIFFAKGWDRAGKEFVISAKVGKEEFEIATFRKDSKSSDGRTPDHMEFAGLDEDAKRRDFTANSMYIPLTNADGPNTKLIDPHGGAHHLRKGEIHWVGNPKERLEEDQLRALRYIRSIASHGKNTKIDDETKNAIADIKDLPAVSRERIREEFLKGLKHADIDPIHYVKMYKDLGLLNTVFPDVNFKLDVPEDYSEKKEPRLAIAWLLRNNDPSKIKKTLEQGTWTNEEVRQIIHLVDLAKYFSTHKQDPEAFFDQFYEKNHDFQRSGLVPTMVKEWGKMNKLPEDLVYKFAHHKTSTPGKVEEDGKRKVNPEIFNFLGKNPQGEEWKHAMKNIETKKFRNNIENTE